MPSASRARLQVGLPAQGGPACRALLRVSSRPSYPSPTGGDALLLVLLLTRACLASACLRATGPHQGGPGDSQREDERGEGLAEAAGVGPRGRHRSPTSASCRASRGHPTRAGLRG
eukprot:scaffold260_cov328-Prasinococcus_capsulatus_cf.AAC.6